MKILKKLCAVILILMQILICGFKVNAANIDEIKQVERAEKGYYCVQKWNGSKWIYLTYNRTYYTDKNNEKYLAYCLCPGLPGAGYVTGEVESYQVKINNLIEDDRIWRIIKNGYPYKTLEELQVETADDAYFATMQAVNCVLRGYTLEQAKQLYSVGTFAINGENFTDIQRRGSKTLSAMFNLIDIGLNGKEVRSDLLNVSIEKVTDFEKENNQVYSQTFKVKSTSEIISYQINSVEGLPQDAYITDINGNKRDEFKNGEEFKIIIPKESIKNDINGNVTIKAKLKTYPIYYGKSLLEGYQDFALCNIEYSEIEANCEINIDSKKSTLIIKKIDEETKEALEGVKFQVATNDGIINVYVTNEKGLIEINNLKPGQVCIKELEALDNYKLNEKEINVNLEYNEVSEVEVKNKLKKGNLKIVKVDQEDSNIKLSNVKFELRDEQNNKIAIGITDENGTLYFKDLLIGKYKLIEINTNDNYEIMEAEINVIVEDNETIEIIVPNKKKETLKEEQNNESEIKELEEVINIEKELPKTGNKINFLGILVYISLIAVFIVFGIYKDK